MSDIPSKRRKVKPVCIYTEPALTEPTLTEFAHHLYLPPSKSFCSGACFANIVHTLIGTSKEDFDWDENSCRPVCLKVTKSIDQLTLSRLSKSRLTGKFTCTERVVYLEIDYRFAKHLTEFSWKSLKHVHIVDPVNYEGYITDDMLLFICSLDKLQSLNFLHCDNLTDASLIEIARRCKKLTELEVTSCRYLTDAPLIEITKQCKELRNLNVSDCFFLTDCSIIEIAKHCQKLTELNVSWCTSLTDSPLIEIAKHCNRLRKLNVSMCLDLTDAFLIKVEKHCPNSEIIGP